VVKRPRSNTPLQALTLQNDPVYVEAAWSLAERVMRELPAKALEEQLQYAFRTVLSRPPTDVEVSALRETHKEAFDRYRTDLKARRQLLGDRAVPNNRPVVFIAWFNVAQVLLNLDETITKN
jgi:hypothetical protein